VGAEFAALESEIADLRARVEAADLELLIYIGVLAWIATEAPDLSGAVAMATRAIAKKGPPTAYDVGK